MAGHITKRAKDSYTVVVDWGTDPVTGKRRQVKRSLKGTRKEAEALRARLLHERHSGIDQPVEKLTLADFLRRWLGHVQANREPRTYQTSADIATRHVIPALGSLPLAKLRPLHIQGY